VARSAAQRLFQPAVARLLLHFSNSIHGANSCALTRAHHGAPALRLPAALDSLGWTLDGLLLGSLLPRCWRRRRS